MSKGTEVGQGDVLERRNVDESQKRTIRVEGGGFPVSLANSLHFPHTAQVESFNQCAHTRTLCASVGAVV